MLFQYVGVDSNGHFVRGELDAESKQHLIAQLDEQGIFAVMWRNLDPAPALLPPRSETTDETSTSVPVYVTPILWPQGFPALPFTFKKWMLFLIPLFFFFHGYHSSMTQSIPGWPTHSFRQRLGQINIGDHRSKVEKILGKEIDPQSGAKNFYAGSDGITVEVSYTLATSIAGGDDTVSKAPIIHTRYSATRH
jgi:hypothetical protein